jgi:hypothetical protein
VSRVLEIWSLACVGVAFYAVITLPSWLLTSINRGSLWRLRDNLFDARRHGDLPDSKCVAELLELMERMIVVTGHASALQLWWARRRLAWDEEQFYPPLSPDDLAADAARTFMRYQHDLVHIVMRQYMTGSWSGLLLVAPRHLGELRHVIFDKAHHDWRDPEDEVRAQSTEEGRRETTIVHRIERAAPLFDIDNDLVSASA